MRLSLDVIVILTISLVAVALERPSSAPAKQVAAHVGTVTQQSDTQLLVQIEKDLFKAHMTSAPEVVEVVGKVLADDWVNLEPDRRGPGKPEMMEFLHQRSGQLPSHLAQRDLQVFLFGNTAVATYFQQDTAKPDEHPVDVTDVFVKDNETWKLRLTRGSPHFQQ